MLNASDNIAEYSHLYSLRKHADVSVSVDIKIAIVLGGNETANKTRYARSLKSSKHLVVKQLVE